MYTFTPVMPHGALEELFPGVFVVTGTSRPHHLGMTWQFSRNMTVVREGEALTLINTVRLDADGLAALDRLGTVAHVVKIGAFHGIDDAFYVDRYKARLWAFPGMQHESGLLTDGELRPGGAMPFSDGGAFVFATTTVVEGILVIDRAGGIAVSCDSLQNWAEVDRFFSPESAALMQQHGFITPCNVGPEWLRFCKPQASDFARILELQFCHLLSAHGTPVIGDAKERYAARFKELFGIG